MLRFTAYQLDRLGLKIVNRDYPQMRLILFESRHRALEDGRDRETKYYLSRGWGHGLRTVPDLVIYAGACLDAGGDIGEVGSIRRALRDLREAGHGNGAMGTLLETLPVDLWGRLRTKLPRRSRWQEILSKQDTL